jgi:hypothetical protein
MSACSKDLISASAESVDQRARRHFVFARFQDGIDDGVRQPGTQDQNGG